MLSHSVRTVWSVRIWIFIHIFYVHVSTTLELEPRFEHIPNKRTNWVFAEKINHLFFLLYRLVPVVVRLWFWFLSLWHRPKSKLWRRNKKNVASMVRARSTTIMATHIILQATHSTLLDTVPTHNNQDTTPTHRPVREYTTIFGQMNSSHH